MSATSLIFSSNLDATAAESGHDADTFSHIWLRILCLSAVTRCSTLTDQHSASRSVSGCLLLDVSPCVKVGVKFLRTFIPRKTGHARRSGATWRLPIVARRLEICQSHFLPISPLSCFCYRYPFLWYVWAPIHSKYPTDALSSQVKIRKLVQLLRFAWRRRGMGLLERSWTQLSVLSLTLPLLGLPSSTLSLCPTSSSFFNSISFFNLAVILFALIKPERLANTIGLRLPCVLSAIKENV